jgi:hypothetical protein
MKALEYPLEREWSPLYLFYSSLGLNPIPTTPISYFLTAAHSQVRFDVSIRIVVSMSYWLNWTLSLAIFFRSVWLSLSYHHNWEVDCEILSVGAKGSSSIRWCRSTTRVRIMILCQWPHPFCVDHSYLPQTSSCGQNFHPLLEEKIPYVRFCLPLIKNHQSYFTNLQHHATAGSLSLKPTKSSLVW